MLSRKNVLVTTLLTVSAILPVALPYSGIITFADDFAASENEFFSDTIVIDDSNEGGDLSVNFGSNSAKFMWDDSESQFGVTHPLNVGGASGVLRMGPESGADIYINFNDGTNRLFGWDDSAGALSTFGTPFSFRNVQSSEPPQECGAVNGGDVFMDSDTGILYVCDTSSSRNKWVSFQEITLRGENSSSCASGSDADTSANCAMRFGNGLGGDGASDLGTYIPYPAIITGYSFSADDDACTSGSFDVEIWSTEQSDEDNTYYLISELATGLTGETGNSNGLNVNLQGGEFITVGIDNNCGQTIDDFFLSISYRYRHP